MRIDIPTALVFIALICGMVGLVFVAGRGRTEGGELSWRVGVAGMMVSVSIALILSRPVLPGWLSIAAANAIFAFAFGVAWAAVRAFNGLRAPWIWVGAGAAVWIASCLVPPIYSNISVRIGVISLITAAYSFALAREFWRDTLGERLFAQRALAFVSFFHALVVTFRAGYAMFVSAPETLLDGGWVEGLLVIEPAIALVISGILGVGLVRERAERELRFRAETDGLTGLLNRHAFFLACETIARAARTESRDIALIVFDLDHFKTINDRHGHLAGDNALQLFADVVRSAVRASDIVGRVGGEEFAVLLDGIDRHAAEAIAERIRREMAESRIHSTTGPVVTTVSAGVAVSSDMTIRELFATADRALYEAKRMGRDRVRSAIALAS